jgi:hypothetical protein
MYGFVCRCAWLSSSSNFSSLFTFLVVVRFSCRHSQTPLLSRPHFHPLPPAVSEAGDACISSLGLLAAIHMWKKLQPNRLSSHGRPVEIRRHTPLHPFKIPPSHIVTMHFRARLGFRRVASSLVLATVWRSTDMLQMLRLAHACSARRARRYSERVVACKWSEAFRKGPVFLNLFVVDYSSPVVTLLITTLPRTKYPIRLSIQ